MTVHSVGEYTNFLHLPSAGAGGSTAQNMHLTLLKPHLLDVSIAPDRRAIMAVLPHADRTAMTPDRALEAAHDRMAALGVDKISANREPWVATGDLRYTPENLQALSEFSIAEARKTARVSRNVRKCPKCGSDDVSVFEAHADTGMDEMQGRCRSCRHRGEVEEFLPKTAGFMSKAVLPGLIAAMPGMHAPATPMPAVTPQVARVSIPHDRVADGLARMATRDNAITTTYSRGSAPARALFTRAAVMPMEYPMRPAVGRVAAGGGHLSEADVARANSLGVRVVSPFPGDAQGTRASGSTVHIHPDEPRAAGLHELTHALDPAAQPGAQHASMYEPEIPAMVSENVETMRQTGLTPGHGTWHDDSGAAPWVYEHMKKHGPKYDGTPRDVDATKKFVDDLRGQDPHLKAAYDAFLEQAPSALPGPVKRGGILTFDEARAAARRSPDYTEKLTRLEARRTEKTSAGLSQMTPMTSAPDGGENHPPLIGNPFMGDDHASTDYENGYQYAQSLGHQQLNVATEGDVARWQGGAKPWVAGFCAGARSLGVGRIADTIEQTKQGSAMTHFAVDHLEKTAGALLPLATAALGAGLGGTLGHYGLAGGTDVSSEGQSTNVMGHQDLGDGATLVSGDPSAVHPSAPQTSRVPGYAEQLGAQLQGAADHAGLPGGHSLAPAELGGAAIGAGAGLAGGLALNASRRDEPKFASAHLHNQVARVGVDKVAAIGNYALPILGGLAGGGLGHVAGGFAGDVAHEGISPEQAAAMHADPNVVRAINEGGRQAAVSNAADVGSVAGAGIGTGAGVLASRALSEPARPNWRIASYG